MGTAFPLDQLYQVPTVPPEVAEADLKKRMIIINNLRMINYVTEDRVACLALNRASNIFILAFTIIQNHPSSSEAYNLIANQTID